MKIQNTIYKKRRRVGKTNYHKRLILIKSNYPRFVVRKTNRYLILQIVESYESQDKVLYSLTTKELLKFGWPKENIGSLKSLSAGYLAGLLIGKLAANSGFKKNIILDSGLIRNTKNSRVYTAVKGISDAGLNIPFDKDIVPKDEVFKKYNFFDNIKKEILKNQKKPPVLPPTKVSGLFVGFLG